MNTATSKTPSNYHSHAHKKCVELLSCINDKTNATTMLSRRYSQLLRSENYYDCVFHIGDANIKCHKLILSAASPVFAAMFYGPLREQQPDIELIDMSTEIFSMLIEYIYTGILDYERLTLEDCVELYYGGEKYLLNDLIDDCLAAIMRKLRFSNILSALDMSVCLDFRGLREICMSFFASCCLADPQYMNYLKAHAHVHVSKECIKMIIAANKEQHKQQLLCFVDEWCQHECEKFGLQKMTACDDAHIINDLAELKSCCNDSNSSIQSPKGQLQLHRHNCSAIIERSCYKACPPFIVENDAHEWKLIMKCDRFIMLLGIVLHSRLTPSDMQLAHFLHFPTEYNESLRIEITAHAHNEVMRNSNGSGEEDPSYADNADAIIWSHNVSKQSTKYNCDLNINWPDGVILSPDIGYQLKIIWQADAYGAEYPCSILSNSVEGIQFRDYVAHAGSLIKGLRFLNLV